MQCRSEKESGREEANETSEQTTWVLLSKGRDSVEGGNIAGDLNCEAERGQPETGRDRVEERLGGGVGTGSCKKKGLLVVGRPPWLVRNPVPCTLCCSPHISKKGYAKLGCTENFWTNGKIRVQPGNSQGGSQARSQGPAGPPCPLGKTSARSRPSALQGATVVPGGRDLRPGSPARWETAHVGRAGCISAATARSAPGPGPRAAPARPLGGDCALAGAPRRPRKRQAEPGDRSDPSLRIPGTEGQRQRPRILTLEDMPSGAVMNIDLCRIS
ncbi:uncharacterized protein LOC120617385 [Pteropus medius]|uniref:uncharacterized protein LOC120617385 n=1 Tax=Pteropus vampyrus TaxID=132908 RepID=UPI00196B6EF1|nr:uncharacterized protein LOC120617385 [Pteropus giganteus]